MGYAAEFFRHSSGNQRGVIKAIWQKTDTPTSQQTTFLKIISITV
jgi:hypothetical protein